MVSNITVGNRIFQNSNRFGIVSRKLWQVYPYNYLKHIFKGKNKHQSILYSLNNLVGFPRDNPIGRDDHIECLVSQRLEIINRVLERHIRFPDAVLWVDARLYAVIVARVPDQMFVTPA